MRASLAVLFALVAAALSGCYDTEQRVLQQGQDVGLSAGTWRCQNTGDKDGGTVALTGPFTTGAGGAFYGAVVDNSTYTLRMEKSRDLIIVEADEKGRISHVFLRRESDGSYSMLVPDDRPALEVLAKRHGVTLTFDRLGPPKPRGTPEQLRAFLRDHTGPELKKTSACRKAA